MAKAKGTDYHKIRSIEVTGGFLQDLKLDFHDSLNCVIGGRGTGKTTVLEAIRYALDRMPDPTTDKDRFRAIEKLLQSNLGGASVRVQIETLEGACYTVARGFGESPLITNEEDRPVDINIGRDIIFGADIYSQNQIEDIANDAFFQLQLIDKFIQPEVDELERQIRDTTKELEANATRILDMRRVVADLTEAVRELPDINEKIRSLEKATQGGEGELLRKEHEGKAARTKEQQVVDGVRDLYDGEIEAIGVLAEEMGQRFEDTFDVDLTTTPNRELMEKVRNGARTAIQSVVRRLETAQKDLASAQTELDAVRAQLEDRQALQDKQYRELLDKHEQERAKGIERAKLEQRYAELKTREKQQNDRRADLLKLTRAREQLRTRLSDQRDQRYKLRVGVADQLNEHLSPMIRIRVEQFGNMDEYRSLLTQSMKGSGLRYAAIVDKIVERVPPSELASLVQNEDRTTLERELDLEADRATRLIIQLKDKPEVFEIETVELHDRPIMELKDGPDYKDSASLSTGQKCTTILPILLMESERPLLIDQPEDNLDNAFVFETIVQSIREVRGRRQLIFVTHNPNIPVLSDAGRVFALRSSGRAASLANAGTVDEVAQEIMTILEGGRAAFEARQKRYGQPMPSKAP